MQVDVNLSNVVLEELEITMEIRLATGPLLDALKEKALTAATTNEFCSDVVAMIKPYFKVVDLVLFTRFDNDSLELVGLHGRPYAKLIDGRFLKLNRKTPVTDAVRLQRNQVWPNNQKLLLEYPDLIEWPKIIHAVIAIPVIIKGISVAACAYLLDEEFLMSDFTDSSDFLVAVSNLIYQVHLRTSI